MISSADDIDSDILEHGMFSNEEDFKLALRSIRGWDEHDARELLRSLLMVSGSLGGDTAKLQQLSSWSTEELLASGVSEYWLRLQKYAEDKQIIKVLGAQGDEEDLPEAVPPWEGITWTLDLVRFSPNQAVSVIDAYMRAHLSVLPDGRLDALEDAASLVRARYIGLPEHTEDKIRFLLERHPRDFETLTARLYAEMGYKVAVTPQTRDGGKDIIATRKDPGRREELRIECKRYDRTVGVEVARCLLGVLSDEKATKGIIVTTSDFSSDARAYASRNPRLELVNGRQLVLLLNEYLGFEWPLHIERLVYRPVPVADDNVRADN